MLTNKPPCGPKRGHGTPQPRYALECHFDSVAERLGIPVLDLRRKNFLGPNTPDGQSPAHHQQRPRRVRRHRRARRALRGATRQAAVWQGHRLRRGRLPVRRGPAALLERHAAQLGRHSARSQRPGDRLVRPDRHRPGLERDAGDRRVRSARRAARADQSGFGRHGPHADRSGQLFESGHVHGWQRGHLGGESVARAAARGGLGRARRPAGRARPAQGRAQSARRPRPEAELRRAGQAGRVARWRADRDRQLQAAATGWAVQGLGRGPEPGVQLLGGRGRGGRRSADRLGHGREGVARARHRPRA